MTPLDPFPTPPLPSPNRRIAAAPSHLRDRPLLRHPTPGHQGQRLAARPGPSGPVHAVDTGQHYDYALNDLLYQQLKVSPPDRFLEVGSAGHAEQTALILTRTEAVLAELTPAAVVVIGDTNSTLGAALAAAKLRIPVVHVEAGLRARDRMMAEELNRRAVDAIAALLCTPCASATTRMSAERPRCGSRKPGTSPWMSCRQCCRASPLPGRSSLASPRPTSLPPCTAPS